MGQLQTRGQLRHVDLLPCAHLKEPALLPRWLFSEGFVNLRRALSDTSDRTFHVFLSTLRPTGLCCVRVDASGVLPCVVRDDALGKLSLPFKGSVAGSFQAGGSLGATLQKGSRSMG